MSKIGEKILKIFLNLLSVVVIALAIFGGWSLYQIFHEPKAEIVNDSGKRLFGTTEKRIVTKAEVKTKIYDIGELSTYSGEYNIKKTVDESRYIFDDIKIPGTKNTISLECTGKVKIGYNMSEIEVSVDDSTIHVKIPKGNVMSNYIIWDSIKSSEKNSIFNPINFEQYKKLIDEIEEEGLKEVEAKGIYTRADENFKSIIKAFLAEFKDYGIEFTFAYDN